jgi:hypothetical protein
MDHSTRRPEDINHLDCGPISSMHHDAHHAADQVDNPVCYHQNCPVCGRNLRIGVRLLGRRVYCQHCGGGFIASDSATGTTAVERQPQLSLVDELIERAAVMLSQGGE